MPASRLSLQKGDLVIVDSKTEERDTDGYYWLSVIVANTERKLSFFSHRVEFPIRNENMHDVMFFVIILTKPIQSSFKTQYASRVQGCWSLPSYQLMIMQLRVPKLNTIPIWLHNLWNTCSVKKCGMKPSATMKVKYSRKKAKQKCQLYNCLLIICLYKYKHKKIVLYLPVYVETILFCTSNPTFCHLWN